MEHGNPVSVLQIVRGADPVLGITTVRLPPTRKPRAAFTPTAVTERKSLLQATPIRLRADRKPKPGGAGFEIRVADRASHFCRPILWGVFGEYLWTNGRVP